MEITLTIEEKEFDSLKHALWFALGACPDNSYQAMLISNLNAKISNQRDRQKGLVLVG